MNRRQLLRRLGAAAVALRPAVRSMAELGASGAGQAGAGRPPATDMLMNQLGYLPSSAKQATVRNLNPGQRDFQIRSAASNGVVFRGNLSQPFLDAASGEQTAIADFSALRTTGLYVMETGGSNSSPFPITAEAYAAALRRVVRAFYGQRCGCAVDLGEGYKHPLCHAGCGYHPSSGKSGELANHGGWHDAGDYGRYMVNSGITTGSLLWAWELYPQPLRGLHLNIPESGGKLPDYLAEVRWNLEWMLSLQDADGGVWHKQTSERFCAFILPQDDHLTSYVIGTGTEPYKSTCATADLAAVMAIAARCYGAHDSAFAQRCLAAARGAWRWAIQHPQVTFENPPGVATGGYEDKHCGDEILWASGELWRTTHDAQYEKALLAGMPAAGGGPSLAAPGWGDVASMAYWTYAMAGGGDSALKARIREATTKAATELVERSRLSGYGNTLKLSDYGWGSNSVAANQSLLLLIANHFYPNRSFREAALGNLHYLLGRNCHGVSWVTQLGERPYEHPHHRPSAADKIAAPWPGLLSGGPNAHGGDAIADQLPRQAPMRMWVDDERAYSLNEVAINWNAPLVFVLAAANS